MSRILSVSYDETVSKLRFLALQSAGYDVTALNSIDAALALAPRLPFDLVVIGHRFAFGAKEALIKKSRTEWNAKVILVCGADNDPELHPDLRVYGLQGIDGIVEAAHKLVPVPATTH